MVKRLAAIFFLLSLLPVFSESQGYKKIFINMEIGEPKSTLIQMFYVFDTLEAGDKLCKEEFNFKRINEIYDSDDFKPMMRLHPGSNLQKYNYAIMKNGFEIWFFKNIGDGYLYGRGFFSYKIGENTQ